MLLDVAVVRAQIEQLKLTNPEIWESEDIVLLEDSLLGSTELYEFLTICEDRRQDSVSTAAGIATRIAELGLRQKRYEHREQAMRALIFRLMTAAEVRKVELPIATISIGKGREKLVILDKDAVPPHLRRPGPPDMAAIKGERDAGMQFNWVAIEPATQQLIIRTK